MKTGNQMKTNRLTSVYDEQTPALSVREFLSGGSALLGVLTVLMFTAAYMYMFKIEFSDSDGVMLLLGAGGTAVLAIGALVSFIGAKIRYLGNAFASFGIIMTMIGMGVLGACCIFRLFGETTVLGAAQALTFIAAIVSLLIMFVVLFAGMCGARVSPSIGLWTAVLCTIAAIMLTVRLLSTYVLLTTQLGDDMMWEHTEGMTSELRWVLRDIDYLSAFATEMFYARLAELVTLVLLVASLLPLTFGFKGFFTDFNRHLEILDELPVRHRNDEDNDYYGGWQPRKDAPRDEYDYDDVYGDDYDEPVEDTRRRPIRPVPVRRVEGSYYTDLFEDDDQSETDERRPAPRRQGRPDGEEAGGAAEDAAPMHKGPVRVKVRTVSKTPKLPDFNDPSIWDHYMDE